MTPAVLPLHTERARKDGEMSNLTNDHKNVLDVIARGSKGGRKVSSVELPRMSDDRHPSSRIGKLVKLGLVERVGRGLYRATSKGKVWAEQIA